ncbi:MAG: hypothetical protein HYY20_10600 [Candidatus Tectomicrobia bacterium]|uniref:Uncharacterized protein n=1 Tax=Tectimicrobiota bacterium TaxID=2528274 RepID=A0A932FW14_UNCTE|nr:hypothetical protein [Candidatus Tectomicrobia bacterium]
MARLIILGPDGHQEIQWDLEAVETGDPEAIAVIQEAERILEAAWARGGAAFRVKAPDQPAERLERFDRAAEQIIVVPQMAGG